MWKKIIFLFFQFAFLRNIYKNAAVSQTFDYYLLRINYYEVSNLVFFFLNYGGKRLFLTFSFKGHFGFEGLFRKKVSFAETLLMDIKI